MLKTQEQRKISRTSLSSTSLTSSWSGLAESPFMGSSPSIASSSYSNTSSSSVSVGITEERHMLFCGSKNSGKTSLIFTLGRGFFPSEDILPSRFEGWSVSASATPMPIQSYGEGSKKQKSSVFNLTLWEDRPRMNLFEKQMLEKKRKRQEEKQKVKAANSHLTTVEARNKNGEVAENVFSNGLRIHYPNNSKTIKTANEANENFAPGNPNKSMKCSQDQNSSQSEDDSTEEISVSQRPPLLGPDPDILVLCYSVDNPDSFTNIENEIWTEVKERFPDIPIILVANKSDLIREEEQQTYKSDVVGSCDEEQLVGEEPVGINQETKDHELEDDGYIWTMDNVDNGFSNQIDSASMSFIPPSMGNELAKKIGARIFIECSAKELQGLNRIIEEAVWTLLVKNSNPLIAAFMAGAGSMSGNLASSVNSSLPPIGPSRKVSDSNNPNSWTPFSSLLNKTGPPLSTSWPRSPNAGSSPASGNAANGNGTREEKPKSRKTSTTSNGSSNKIYPLISMTSRPVITIENQLFGTCAYATSSPQAVGRQRKTSYGAAVKKIWQNVNSKNKD